MTECCVEHVRDLSHHGGDGEKNKRNYGLARVPDNDGTFKRTQFTQEDIFNRCLLHTNHMKSLPSVHLTGR